MTVAIGLCGNEGIVLAADSQETISGYMKTTSRGKIHTLIFPSRAVVSFTGAGQSDYIETAIDKAAIGLSDLKTLPEIGSLLEKNLLTFFDNHLARWAFFPPNERPTVEMLIGVTTVQGAFGLFHYEGTSFHRVSQKAIGAGILLADSLISEYTSVTATVNESISAAVYILSKVKKRVDSCGGFTDLVALRKGGDFALTNSKEIEKLEEEFEIMERQVTKGLEQKIIMRVLPGLLWQSDMAKTKEKKSSITPSSSQK